MIHWRPKTVAIITCLVLAFSIRAAAQINLNPTVADSFGLCIHFTDPKPGEMKMLTDTGARWIRIEIPWDRTETSKGQYDFSAYDRLMANLQQFNMHALFILFSYGNKLYDNGQSPYTDSGRQAFAQWAVALVQHFQGRGVIWEMWNEPEDGFWKPKGNVDDYIKLALAVGQALRKAAPAEIYVGPDPSSFVYSFLEPCFKAGLLNYWSAVTIHGYRQAFPETITADYRSLRSLIAKYAPAGKQIPIINSEWGYAINWGFVGSEENQAGLFVRTLLTDLAAGIPLTFWYQWYGDPTALTKGLYPVLDPRPSYFAARNMTSVLNGYRFDRQLPANAGDWLLQFRNGSKTIVAAWTVGNSHPVTVPANGRFRVIGTAGQALPDAASSGRGVPITLTQAPQYLVPQ
jgi:hypothetical protein